MYKLVEQNIIDKETAMEAIAEKISDDKTESATSFSNNSGNTF